MTRLRRFVFAEVDGFTAGVFRLVLAGLALTVFGSWGVQPLGFIRRLPLLPELYAQVFQTTAYRALALVSLVVWGAGWRPRLAGPAALLLLAPLVPSAGVSQSRQVVFVAIAAFSLLRSDVRLSVRPCGGSVGPMWPVRLVQWQVSLLYAVNAISKATPQFLSGDVLVGLSRSAQNVRMDLSSGTFDLGFVAVPVSWVAIGVVMVETWLAVGFWMPRARVATACLGIAFHAAASMFITIAWLGWTSVILYLVFLLPFEKPVPGGGLGPQPADGLVRFGR